MTSNQRLESYISLILRYRWLVIALSTVVVVVIAGGAPNVKVGNSYRLLFEEDDVRLVALDALERTFSESNSVIIAIAPQDESVFTRETLSAIEELTEAAWSTPFSTRVDSLANYNHSWAEEDDLIVEPLVDDATNLREADLARIREIALSENEVVGSLVSADGSTAGLIITFVLPDEPEQAVVEITDHLNALLDQQRVIHPDNGYYASGFPYINRALLDSTEEDLATLFPIAFVVILVLMGILFRCVASTVATLVIVLFTVFSTMGFVGWSGFVLSPPNAGIPIIVLTIATADAIHVVSTVLTKLRSGQDKQVAIAESLRVNMWPVFLTSVTTMVGFLSFNASDAPPFHIMGNSVAFGVLCAFAYSVFLLPALLSILPLRAKPTKLQFQDIDIFSRLADFVIAHRKLVFLSFTLVSIILISGIHRIELGDNLIKFFEKSNSTRLDSEFIVANLTGLDKMEYSLDSGSEGGIFDPEYLQKVELFAAWLREQPKVVHVSAFSDLMKRLNRNLHGDDPSHYRLPDDQNLAAQYLFIYELSLPYGRDLNNRIDIAKSATRLTATVEDATSGELRELNTRALSWLQENIPEFRQEASGKNVIVAYMTQQNITSMLGGTLIAMGLICVLLMCFFRSVKIGALSLIPNFLPAFLTFGLWGYLVGQIGIASAVIVAFAFGIVVDDTVHFLSKYLKARREGQQVSESIRYTFHTVGRALWTTTAVLSAGFLVFLFSGFAVSWVLGLLVTITIVFALAADFLLLPTLLMIFDRRKT